MIDDVIELVKSDDTITPDEPIFDIERMKQALKGCESKEEALKNGISVPDWALRDFESFQQWIDERKSAKAI